MNNMIFLDFDGVLFDPVREAFVTATMASNKVATMQNIDFDTHHYREFLKYRYLVGPAWNYKYLIDLIFLGQHTDFEENYRSLIESANNQDISKYEKKFFNAREKLKIFHPEEWLSLNKPYPFLGLIKQLLIEQISCFTIVTTKDRETVKNLLLRQSLNFPDCQIYDKEDYSLYQNKAELIKNIINMGNIENALFIDDNSDHLNKCRKIQSLELCQPNWGYVGPSDNSTMTEKQVIDKIRLITG